MFSAASRGIPSFGDNAFKRPVKFATLGTGGGLQANTLVPNTAPVFGQTLEANANGDLNAAAAWNGVTITTPIVAGDRVLIRSEAPPKNGIWVVTSVGGVGSKWKLTRATDADTPAELQVGAFVVDNLLGDAESGGLAAGIYVRTDDALDVWDMLPQIVNPFFTSAAAQIFFNKNVQINGNNTNALTVTGTANLDHTVTDDVVLDQANQDVRILRAGTKHAQFDDGTGGPATLEIIGNIILGLVSQAAAVATEGSASWNDTTRGLVIGDSVRAKGVTPIGFASRAWPPGFPTLDTFATIVTLAQVAGGVGGAIASPIVVSAPMLVAGYAVRSADASLLRSAEARLYYSRLDNSATVNEVPNSAAAWSFTPGAASNRQALLTGGAILIPPGFYWLVIRNTSGARGFAVGTSGGGTFSGSAVLTKNIAALGATLDIVTGWAIGNGYLACDLQGTLPDGSTVW